MSDTIDTKTEAVRTIGRAFMNGIRDLQNKGVQVQLSMGAESGQVVDVIYPRLREVRGVQKIVQYKLPNPNSVGIDDAAVEITKVDLTV